MTSNKNKINSIPSNSENPFKVPPGYFEGLQDRVMDKIRAEEEKPEPISRKLYLRPYISLAASISGLALIVYIILQSVVGSEMNEYEGYELAVLEQAGITLDESVVAETWSDFENDEYTEWEEGAMNYLASNEFDLFHLLESN
jgi:hypothetical protein